MENMPQKIKESGLFTYTSVSPDLDPVNRRILGELLREPRMTMSALGRKVGMSSPAVTERVRHLEEAGVIKGYRLEVDPAALGLPVAAYVRVRPGPGQLSRVAELARGIPEVAECHRVTGEDCFILKVHLPGIDQLDRLLDLFLMHGATTTSIIQSSPVPLRALPLPAAGATTE
jgi:Lrp/AsnC family transcriptional regulator, leucine-responsive regulatory protein